MAEPNHYAILLRQIPGLLVDAAGRVTALTFMAGCALGGFVSSKVVNALIAPGWWALVAVGAVLLVALVRSNHQYVKALQLRAAGQAGSGVAQQQHYYYAPVTQYIGTIRTAEAPITGMGIPEPIQVEAEVDDPQPELPLDEGAPS